MRVDGKHKLLAYKTVQSESSLSTTWFTDKITSDGSWVCFSEGFSHYIRYLNLTEVY